jgi:hypothetical protein
MMNSAVIIGRLKEQNVIVIRFLVVTARSPVCIGLQQARHIY